MNLAHGLLRRGDKLQRKARGLLFVRIADAQVGITNRIAKSLSRDHLEIDKLRKKRNQLKIIP
jgi:hypothetical protein